MGESEYEKLHAAFSEGVAKKYADVRGPLEEALEKVRESNARIYAPARTLLDRYNNLLLKFANQEIKGVEKEIIHIGAKLSKFLHEVKPKDEQVLETTKVIEEELDAVQRRFFPPKEDVERN